MEQYIVWCSTMWVRSGPSESGENSMYNRSWQQPELFFYYLEAFYPKERVYKLTAVHYLGPEKGQRSRLSQWNTNSEWTTYGQVGRQEQYVLCVWYGPIICKGIGVCLDLARSCRALSTGPFVLHLDFFLLFGPTFAAWPFVRPGRWWVTWRA